MRSVGKAGTLAKNKFGIMGAPNFSEFWEPQIRKYGNRPFLCIHINAVGLGALPKLSQIKSFVSSVQAKTGGSGAGLELEILVY